MKRYILFLLIIFSFNSNSQIYDPVSWEFSKNKIDNKRYELIFTANIEDGWYIYSQYLKGDGPVPTEFTFQESSNFNLIDKVNEDDANEAYDPNFEMLLKFFKKKAVFVQQIEIVNEKSQFSVLGDIYFMTCDEKQCLPPEIIEFDFKFNEDKSYNFESSSFSEESDNKTVNSASKKSKNFWLLFFVSFLSGFAALLTPCVFPMIPMTVSYFTKASKTKSKGIFNAIIYGISIIIIYVALGVGVSNIFGADALNNMATNVYFNIAFFLLLIVFGASFLGAFDITLPTSWINKSDKASDKGGYIGIFFMAFTLALVSFSCTGPIVGTLLVEAASGGYFGPIIGMLGFSLAIAIPFAIFAAFPGWLNSLPQSGGWLNSVKVTLGFLEIALAFKFLSNADLVLQLHLLERELFIAIWVIIFMLLTFYLLGFIRFAHDSDLKYLSVTRLSLAIITGAFTIYMIPGLWGAPLKLINAFPPPMHYSESPNGFSTNSTNNTENNVELKSGTHLGPQGIYVFHDYEKGLEHAKKENLPVMIDFTGWACVNCRKMEEQVWSDNEVKEILKNEIVIVSLYVDERTKLSEENQYETTLAGKPKKVRTIGDKWMVLQANLYGTNSQPYYVFIDHSGNQLIESANFQDYGTVDKFKDWLIRGLNEFNNI